jgi:hypothetical protein
MSEAVIVGVGWVIIGLAMLALGQLLQGWAARAYVRNHPDGDVSRYMRRKLLYKNMLAGFTISVGTAVLIYDFFWGAGTTT